MRMREDSLIKLGISVPDMLVLRKEIPILPVDDKPDPT
jgi:hypothetical protein